PAGITSAQVAPDGCYKRQNTYACNSVPSAQVSSCTASQSTCIDTTPSKVVNGVTVTLAQAGGCWKYQDDCVSPNSVDYCAPMASTGQCRETASTCTQTDATLNTGCMKYQKTYRCNDALSPAPSNTVKLSDSFTLVSSGYDSAACASQDGNQNCALAESACTSTTPPALPAGITPAQVAPDGCYQRQNKYACMTGNVDTSDCDRYASDANCTLQSSKCSSDSQLNGQCSFEEKAYRCQSAPGKTTTVTDCGSQTYCQSGNCSDTSHPPDPDFARAVTMMEAQREAGVYLDPSTMTIFNGVHNQCSIKLGGLGNCCKKNTQGGQSNNVVAQAVVGNATSNAGGYLLNKTSNLVGSTYAFDSLFQSDAPDFMVNGMSSIFGSGGGFTGGFAPSLSFMGVTATFGGTVPAGATTLLSGQGVTLYFNPATFYLAIAMMVIQEILSCDQDEQTLAMKRGSNLCVKVGSYCSSKFLGSCVERKEGYCCFNSRLARIVNEQGRAQIGRGWGSPEGPDCKGFTTVELEEINFAEMDLTEFYAEIVPNLPVSGAVGGRAATYDITPLKTKVPVYFTK
ncbi:MAG: conjugal transfer protein TraN, partial [Pseudomonadota bacterium]|nr:conjugal transfer protein TraN [Pseudomonadota bacterium]